MKNDRSIIGVSYNKDMKKWEAKIMVNRKRILIGWFTDRDEARRAYDEYAIRVRGINCRLNFPPPEPENLIPNTRLIRVSRGEYAIVDEKNFERLNKYRWHLHVDNKSGVCYVYRYKGTYKQKTIKMHSEVMGITDNTPVDHIFHDGKDNTENHLRICTISQNNKNQKVNSSRGTSKYKGVHFDKRTGKWVAQINSKGKRIYIGSFETQKLAAIAYNEQAIIEYGEYCDLNVIEDD